jgi:hypothetical protein
LQQTVGCGSRFWLHLAARLGVRKAAMHHAAHKFQGARELLRRFRIAALPFD